MNRQQFKEQILYPIYVRVKTLAHSPLHLPWDMTGEAASDALYRLLASGAPCMIARYGATELRLIAGYLNLTRLSPVKRLFKRLTFQQVGFSPAIKRLMVKNASFSPATNENFTRFVQMMIEDGKELDMLACWRPEELTVVTSCERIIKVPLQTLEPFWFCRPWSRILKGKRVLVIHPFAESIRRQYAKRELLFANKEVLPEFELINFVPVFAGLPGSAGHFNNWFNALDSMKKRLAQQEFDIALIGAGPFGFPLAAHIKRQGKQAVHIGGATQLLFGIRGRRWDTMPGYQQFVNNPEWCRPAQSETPVQAGKIESACYW